MLWIRNDLFRIQIRIFWAPDPDPSYGISAYLEIIFKKHLKSNQKEESINYLSELSAIFYFTLQSRIHKPISKIRDKTLFFCSFIFAGSGTIILYLDPGNSSGSDRFRIHNTAFRNLLYLRGWQRCWCSPRAAAHFLEDKTPTVIHLDTKMSRRDIWSFQYVLRHLHLK